MTTEKNSPVLLRKPQVMARVGLKATQIRKLMMEGRFPQSVSIVPGGRSVGWIESEITSWIEARIAASRKPRPNAAHLQWSAE